MNGPRSIDELRVSLAAERYLVDEGLATVVFLALRIRRPLLVEGEPGVGKTELAKALAAATDVPLVRLQCYEGIDVHHALYDWDYQRQLLHLRGEGAEPLYSERFLVRRPLLQALANPGCVLLIDELDRADDEFEAFLLEFLSDFQVTIPEIGTVTAEQPPVVVITSNRTRELHDALRRRCLYHWIEHPDLSRETAIVRARLPEVSERLAAQACALVEQLRWLDLYRVPGVGETLDWTESLAALGASEVEPELTERSLGSLLKAHEDIERVKGEGVAGLIERARGGGPEGGGQREAA
ncbi:MAG TPA: MoxR family ATPase [Solirubrobacterales bacterium]|nr:MoxR family ATPase [Solirubrobacterales bacterium]